MLTKKTTHQTDMEFISIEELVPKDHLLRKIDSAIDFNFIYEKVEELYSSTTGRPSIDPVVLFKMLVIGYLFGVRSERQLIREIEVNMAYRWFLGFGLRDKIPDHSIFSQNRRRRFNDSDIFEEIFDEIVLQAIEHKLVDGHTLYTDSTHLKASANINRFERKIVEKSTRSYIADLDADVAKDRDEHGKKPLKPRDDKTALKMTRVSTTDSDSGFMARKGKPEGFFYLDHRTVDGKHNIITDAHVTPGNVHDSIPYLDRLDRQRERFGFAVESVGLDAGYFTPNVCRGLEERNIYGVMPYIRPSGRKDSLRKNKFVYDEYHDCYLCPEDHVLEYSTTSRDGNRQYKSDPKDCLSCSLLEQCTDSKSHVRTIQRHVWEEYKESVVEHRYESRGKAIYKRRKETVERSFADAKQLHGHRYARYRGLKNVGAQCLLAAAVQNMKKIALYLDRKGPSAPDTPFTGAKLLYGAARTTLQRIQTYWRQKVWNRVPTMEYE